MALGRKIHCWSSRSQETPPGSTAGLPTDVLLSTFVGLLQTDLVIHLESSRISGDFQVKVRRPALRHPWGRWIIRGSISSPSFARQLLCLLIGRHEKVQGHHKFLGKNSSTFVLEKGANRCALAYAPVVFLLIFVERFEVGIGPSCSSQSPWPIPGSLADLEVIHALDFTIAIWSRCELPALERRPWRQWRQWIHGSMWSSINGFIDEQMDQWKDR